MNNYFSTDITILFATVHYIDAIRRAAAEPEAQEDLLQQYEEVLDSDNILLDCNDEELELEILERDGQEYIILPFEPNDISTSDENASFGVTSDTQLTDSASDFENTDR